LSSSSIEIAWTSNWWWIYNISISTIEHQIGISFLFSTARNIVSITCSRLIITSSKTRICCFTAALLYFFLQKSLRWHIVLIITYWQPICSSRPLFGYSSYSWGTHDSAIKIIINRRTVLELLSKAARCVWNLLLMLRELLLLIIIAACLMNRRTLSLLNCINRPLMRIILISSFK
jgi:hypothetical protein